MGAHLILSNNEYILQDIYYLEAAMKTAKLFKNGKSQAVRLPKEFRFQGSEVYIKRIGGSVILVPKDDPWGSLVSSLDGFSDDFMEKREQPGLDHRETL